MNKFFTQSIFAIALVLCCNFIKAYAQVAVSPTTTGVSLFCSGGAMTLALPTTPNTTWKLMYSDQQTTTPSTPVAMINGAISAADTKTGFYYLSSKSNDPNSCESDMQEIPVYVLKPLVVDFTNVDFCVASPQQQTGSVTSNDQLATTLAYQWYTLTGTTENIISGATQADYTPTNPTVGTTKYRLKVGYLIGANKYCPAFVDKDVTVTAKPTKPTITPTQIQGTAGAVTF
ncbi:MAG: hypothetical protein EOO92_24635 [Pedobacter sp.]|nr:MAG: hypothetical protein EOO92_24635 [Pedobacter sp.]